MRPHLALGALALATTAAAQSQTILFSGRFPFVSLAAANERPGGAISQLEEFDFSYVAPGLAAVARTLLPATAMNCYLGDGNGDGNYTKFFGLKTYFQNLQIGGLFVKHADRANVTFDKVYFTVRDNIAPQQFEVFTNGGAQVHVLRPGDWVRFLPNGNVEFFVDADQLDVAAGPPAPGQGTVKGAHALLQSASGDLYYAPVEGGQWVNGNIAAMYCNDGSIVKIDAANITYDGSGNVAAFAPNSARCLVEETQSGAGVSTRQMVLNSGGQDRTGAPLVVAGVFGKVAGLAFDPAGGTFQPAFADAAGNFPPEPNLLFCSDPGSYAGTIFSTASSGRIAVINGVLCGSTTPGVPATGAWLGVQLNVANAQPSLMGMQLVDQLAHEPLILDTSKFGALETSAVQPLWELDLQGAPFAVSFLFTAFGPGNAGAFVSSIPLLALPPVFAPGSHPDVFVAAGPQTLGLAVSDVNGYATWSFANPNAGGLAGVALVLQAAESGPAGFRVSTPVLMQLK
jgi:hypothetical protein